MAKQNDISMAYSIDEVPDGHMKQAEVYRLMIEAVRNGSGILPKGLKVTWMWRTAPDKELRRDEFGNLVRTCNRGFRTLMERRLSRDSDLRKEYDEK